MDGWYEEEEEVFVHARDPHTRVDVLPSSRHVRVAIDGVVVADTRRPHLLFETTLPTRYYIPREEVRMELLEPTGLKTRCRTRASLRYWNVRVGQRVLRTSSGAIRIPLRSAPRSGASSVCSMSAWTFMSTGSCSRGRPRLGPRRVVSSLFGAGARSFGVGSYGE